MSSGSRTRSAQVALGLVWAGSLASPLTGVLGLLGWSLDRALESSGPLGLIDLAPHTALGLILGGGALGLLHPPEAGAVRRAAGRACAVGMAVIGIAILFRYFGLELVRAVMTQPWTQALSRPPSEAPEMTATALCFVLLGGGLLLLGRAEPRPSWRMEALLLPGLFVTLMMFNGLLHGELVSVNTPVLLSHTGMGLQTAAGLLLLGVGALCARPAQGVMIHVTRLTLGGYLARRLVPVTLLGPLLFGALLEVLARFELLGEPLKTPLFATVASLGSAGLVLVSTALLDRLHQERLRVRAALAASEERYRDLLETAPDPVVAVDQHGMVRFVNAQVERVFGYQREELIGHDVAVLLPESMRAQQLQSLEKYMRAPVVRSAGLALPLRGLRKDGSEFPVEVSLSPCQTPEGLTVTAIIRDVTEREQHVARLQDARAEAERERLLLQTVVDSAPVGILFVDPETDKVRTNVALTAMLGRPVDPSEGQERYQGSFLHPDGRAVSLDEFPSTRALTGQAFPAQEFLIVRPDRQVPVLASAAPVFGSSEAVRGVVVTIQDITARRELEQLQHDYVGLISHDLRNPLQVIALRTQLLQRLLEERGMTREAALAGSLLQNTRQMSWLVEELLENSILEAGQVELRREPTELVPFLEEVLDRDLPPDARERFLLEAAGPLPPVLVDAPRLERVVVNLLTNALKYSPPASPIELRIQQTAEVVELSVRDQGLGLLPEDAVRLFQKYYRTKEGRRAKGAGLGLYICRLIVEAHGGAIRVASQPGQGAIFTVTLPLKASPQENRGAERGAA
jgi:two-component system, NtrC family, sensor histidine kinase KinB